MSDSIQVKLTLVGAVIALLILGGAGIVVSH